jgi:NhaP-type Na+/H+ or K+/H+ antiporter
VTTWFLISGGLLIVVALVGSHFRRLPVTTAMFYLAVGLLVGPAAADLVDLRPIRDAEMLEAITEIAVLISLFTTGLKLRAPLKTGLWSVPLRLASISMLVTIGLSTAAGVYLLHLPLGAAVVLGAMLAPTDPVLASEVQVEHAWDPDRLRFGLTGEAGLNDGAAFPFVMLGLGLLGVHELGPGGARWLAVDLLWGVAGGLLIGWVVGDLVVRVVLHLRRVREEALGGDEFLALGLIALAYGTALGARTYGFLAVLAAGLAFRRIERVASGGALPESASAPPGAGGAARRLMTSPVAASDVGEIARDPQQAPLYMAESVLGFNEQIERLAEVVAVLLVGALLSATDLPRAALWFIPLLFLVIRPVSVAIGLIGTGVPADQRRLIGWFGIRGVGSLYYLSYAIAHDLPEALAEPLTSVVLSTVAASVVVHGISVTPLMSVYTRRRATLRRSR